MSQDKPTKQERAALRSARMEIKDVRWSHFEDGERWVAINNYLVPVSYARVLAAQIIELIGPQDRSNDYFPGSLPVAPVTQDRWKK